MDLNCARPKKCRLTQNISLPIILNKDESLLKFKGVYNGVSVIIEDDLEMKKIVSMGCFGKANLSKSYPSFKQNEKVAIIRQRQYSRRKVWGELLTPKQSKQIIVVPDSDEEQEYLTNLKATYHIDSSNLKEKVWLTPEEAFFLNEVVSCLDIYYKGEILPSQMSWDIFSESNKYFQFDYIAYSHFRAKNWVVKPGIKFGGDYLLYQQGPSFYHASYIVIIDILDNKQERINSLTRRSFDNLTLHGLNRLCETTGKELLILQIILPEQKATLSFADIKNVHVKEVLIRRWISNQENN